VGRNAVAVVNPKRCGEGPAPAKVAGPDVPNDRHQRRALTPRAFGSSPARSDDRRARAIHSKITSRFPRSARYGEGAIGADLSASRDRAQSATIGRLIDAVTRTKNQKKTVSGKPEGSVGSGISQMANSLIGWAVGSKNPPVRVDATAPGGDASNSGFHRTTPMSKAPSTRAK
jgi:hypothetical protein